MLLPSPSRFRFYGTPASYMAVVRDLVLGRIRQGDDAARLERAMTERTGAAYAASLPQARFGIYLAIRHLVEPGQAVILSPYTIYDVVNMVIAAGARPIFADVESATCNIDPGQVEALIDDETGAVLVTHLHGLACDMEAISDICRTRKIALLEDAAQAFGGSVDNRSIGTVGDVGIFSFGRAKNVNTFYGGMLVTDDADLHDAIQSELSTLEFEDLARMLKRTAHCLASDVLTSDLVFRCLTFWFFRYAAMHDVESINQLVDTENAPTLRESLPEHYRRRMTPAQARLAIAQLKRVDADTEARTAHATAYHRGLGDIPEVRLPPLREDRSHIYLAYPIQVRGRWDFVKYLMRHGRDVAVQHIGSCADYAAFQRYSRDCPHARQVADSVVLLPTYPKYGLDQVEKTISVVRRYFSRP